MTASRMRSRLGRSLFLLLALLASGCAVPVAPDLVITNARVFTNDTARPWAEAVAIKGERVVAVGDTAALRARAGPSTRVIDAGGHVLVPGFNDARVDLPLGEVPTPAAMSALDRAAIAHGVTSLQVVAGGPMRVLVEAAREAARQARWRVIRSPMDGERPQDEEPFLPPQPGVRLAAKGVSWVTGGVTPRHVADPSRLPTVVGWAYGAEDPIVMAGTAAAWLDALSAKGLTEIWQQKRPRLDVLSPLTSADLPRLARLGVVVTLGTCIVSSDWPPGVSAGAVVDAGIVLAVGSSHPRLGPGRLVGVMTDQCPPDTTAGRLLTREEAVRAATWGSAYAEKGERDKGWLGPGTLADIAVLSDDVFTVPAERLSAITSVLTLVGGTIVYDSGVLTK